MEVKTFIVDGKTIYFIPKNRITKNKPIKKEPILVSFD